MSMRRLSRGQENITPTKSNKKSLTPEKNHDQDEKVKIMIRIRPNLKEESSQDFVEMLDKNTLKVMKPGNNFYMRFADIFDQSINQARVFKRTEENILSFLDGTNGTIFAYGQTGAGKTYSIIGNHPEEIQDVPFEKLIHYFTGPDRGILPRSLELIMNQLKKKDGLIKFGLWVSFLEIYNEKLYDLLNPGANLINGLEIRESKNGSVQIPDLFHAKIENLEECFNYLMIGLKNRVTGCTHANSQSSRSHSVFQIVLTQQIECPKTSKINHINSILRIVDLAGSEKFKIPLDIGKEEKELRIQELTSINGSLSSLDHCISALTEKTRTHIPFRNSKLTRVLRDSLNGSCKINFIICISPSLSSSAETLSTLQFANRAKKAVLNSRNLKEITTKSSFNFQELSEAYEKEKKLRENLELILKMEGSGHPKSEIFQLRKENDELKEQIKYLQQSLSHANITPIKNSDQESGMRSSELGRTHSSDRKGISRGQSPEIWRYDQDSKDISISDNLSILQETNKNSRNRLLDISKDDSVNKIQNFWKNNEDSVVELDSHFIKSKINNNLPLQIIKHKEVEDKIERFFGTESSEGKKDSKIPIFNPRSHENQRMLNNSPGTKEFLFQEKTIETFGNYPKFESIKDPFSDYESPNLFGSDPVNQEPIEHLSIIGEEKENTEVVHSGNLKNIVSDLKKEMSRAIMQLEMLQKEDDKINMPKDCVNKYESKETFGC